MNALVPIGLILIVLASFIGKKNPLEPIESNRQKESINFHSKFLDYSSFGNQRMISSFLWAQTLLTSDLEHYDKDDLNSWMYLRFKTISELDEKFYENYLFGGQYLSIVKDDTLGAELIYKKGISVYPEDYWLLVNRAFNTYYEIGNTTEGIRLYEKVLEHPDSKELFPILPSLLAKMKADEGDLKNAFMLILPKWKKAPEKSPFKDKYETLLYSLKAEIDLTCLNSPDGKKEKCHQVDFKGKPYKLKGGIWKAQQEWKKVKLGRKKKRESEDSL